MPKITLPGGFSFEDVPHWAIGLVAILVSTAAVLAGLYLNVYQPQKELLTAREANDAAMAEVQEFGKHIGEKGVSEYTLSETPLMLARLYKDRCILLVSDTPEGVRSKLVRDLSRDEHRRSHAFVVPFTAVVEAGGQCLEPHPGQMPAPLYGQKQGCLVSVFWTWPDGCQKSGWYDACHGTWNNVQWIKCVH